MGGPSEEGAFGPQFVELLSLQADTDTPITTIGAASSDGQLVDAVKVN